MTIGPRHRTPAGAPVQRVAVISVHTSPLEQPGAGDGGGLNVYVLESVRRLAQRGVEVDIFTRRTAAGQPNRTRIGDGIHVVRVDAGPPTPIAKEELTNHLCSFTLSMLAHADADYDVVHGHYWLSGWVGRRVAERWDVPFVQTFHTLGVLKNATLAPGDVPESPLRLAAERRIAREADKVLGLTCGEARLLHRTFGLSGADIAVVPAGVDLDLFHPEPPPGGDDLDGIVTGEAPLLLFVGRLQPLKGPEVAVATLAHVRKEVPNARLLVVGGTSGSGSGRSSSGSSASVTPWGCCPPCRSRGSPRSTAVRTSSSSRRAARRSGWSRWRLRPAGRRLSRPMCPGCGTSLAPAGSACRGTTRPTMPAQ